MKLNKYYVLGAFIYFVVLPNTVRRYSLSYGYSATSVLSYSDFLTFTKEDEVGLCIEAESLIEAVNIVKLLDI